MQTKRRRFVSSLSAVTGTTNNKQHTRSHSQHKSSLLYALQICTKYARAISKSCLSHPPVQTPPRPYSISHLPHPLRIFTYGFWLINDFPLLLLPDCLPSPDTTRLASSDCCLARLLAVFTLLFSSLWLPELARSGQDSVVFVVPPLN